MKKNLFFIAGTDTGVGKTLVTCALLAAAAGKGLKTAAMKPVSAGCEQGEDAWVNDDALQLQAAMTEKLDYQQVNPVALPAAASPHIAASLAGKNISINALAGYCRGLLTGAQDVTFIEGAGGWRVPVNPRQSLAELAQALASPVILIVGVRLGCLNHALLTVEAIARDGVALAGWVANVIEEDMPYLEENLAYLNDRIPSPCLGVIPWCRDIDAKVAAAALDIDKIL